MVTCSLGDAVESLRRALTSRMTLLPLVCCLAWGPVSAMAQDPTPNFKAADTSSPRDTLRSFIDACNELHGMVKGTQYLDRTDPRHMAIASALWTALTTVKFLPSLVWNAPVKPSPASKRFSIESTCLLGKRSGCDRDRCRGRIRKVTHYRIPDTRITIAKVDVGPRKHGVSVLAGNGGPRAELLREH